MAVTNNFLVPINIPNLQNPNFQSDFSDFCEAIRDNFERLISVQYARGERGTSIESHEVRFIEEVNNVWVLTGFGAEFLNELFNTNVFEQNMDEITAMPLVDGFAPIIGPAHAIDWEVWQTVSVMIFVDPNSGIAYIGDPYIFIDGRINDLPNYIQILNDETPQFTDYSCMYTGSATCHQPSDFQAYSNWNWDGYISQVVPKLYYDGSIHEFCWKVNGQETGITAQGLKGDAGISTATHVCRGTLVGNYLVVNSAERIDYSTNPTRYWDGPNDAQIPNNAYLAIQDNDLIICYYQHNDPTDPYYNDPSAWRAFIGRAIRVQDEVRIWVGTTPDDEQDPRLDIFYTIWNQACADILNSTGYTGSNTENQCRGLWVKDSTDGSEGVLHMLYVDWTDEGGTEHSRRVLRLSPVVSSQGTRDILSPEVHPHSFPEDDGYDFEIDYNIKAQKDFHVQGNTVVNNLTVQGVLDQQGQIQTDLNIAGVHIDTVNKQRPDIQISKFEQALVSQIENVKTYVHGVKLKSASNDLLQGLSIGGDPLNPDDHWMTSEYAGWTNQPTHKIYVGLSFNLHLIIGYLGYGELIADGSIYSRDLTDTVRTYNWPTGSPDRIQINNRSALYNAREYIIPCYMYREVLLGILPNAHETHAFQLDDNSYAEQQMVIQLDYTAAPIDFEGKILHPRIAFDAVLSLVDHAGDGEPDWTGGGNWPQTAGTIDMEVGVRFYQGSIDMSNNCAFGLLDNNAHAEVESITQSRVSCIYEQSDNQSTQVAQSDWIAQFAPLWPYHICETVTQRNPSQSGDYWHITEQPVFNNVPTQKLIYNSGTTAGSEKDYIRYIFEQAYPKMCVFGCGVLTLRATRNSTDPDNVYYTTIWNEDRCIPQSYISFFNAGTMTNQGWPERTSPELEIRRIFRLDGKHVYDGNMNVVYHRLVQDNGISNDLQTLLDEDSSRIGANSITVPAMYQIPAEATTEENPINESFSMSNKVGYQPLTNSKYYTNGDDYLHILGHSVLQWDNKFPSSQNPIHEPIPTVSPSYSK